MTNWVEKQLPEPDNLYSHLKNAFGKLENNSDKIPGADYRVELCADDAWRQLDDANEEDWALKLDPYLVFDLKSDRDFANGHGQARLGGNIEVCDGEYKMFSSSLILAVKEPMEDDDEDLPAGLDQCCIETGKDEAEGAFYHIIDRFHWDIDTGHEKDEGKPVCHIQAGGKISDDAFDDNYEKYHYCSNGMDKPRIPHPPMGPILVFNLLIDQYQSLESFNQKQWTGVVKKGRKHYGSPISMPLTAWSVAMALM